MINKIRKELEKSFQKFPIVSPIRKEGKDKDGYPIWSFWISHDKFIKEGCDYRLVSLSELEEIIESIIYGLQEEDFFKRWDESNKKLVEFVIKKNEEFKKQNKIKSFIEFLKNDKEFLKLLEEDKKIIIDGINKGVIPYFLEPK